MAPPKHSALLSRYQSELKRSIRWRSNNGFDDLWKRMRDLYHGKHLSSASTADRVVINMAFANKNVIAPSVAVNNPRFTVNARRAEYGPQAQIAEEVLNYQWRTNRFQEQFRRAVDDWLIFGHGWVKVGYKFVTEPKVKQPSDTADDPYDAGSEGIDDREPVEGNVESERNVLDDRPYAERVSPFDMFVDPDARTMEDARWVAQRIRRPVGDVKVDSRYRPNIRKNVQASTSARWSDTGRTGSTQPEPASLEAAEAGFVDIIEMYDLRRKYYCVFSENGTDGLLIGPEDMPYSFGHPFLMMRNYDVPDEFYPMGELEQIETPQLELNETRSQMLNHRKRYARKYLYSEDAFSDPGINALESEKDNTMIPVAAGMDINRVIIPMPTVGTPPDFYNQSELIQGDIDRVSGVTDYMRGQVPEIRRTATEAAMMQDAANSRAADKMARVETFLGQLGERVIQLMQQYMTGEQVIRVVGQQNMPVWVNFDRDYIQGQFDFEVEAGSTQPQNEMFRRQSAVQLVDAMAPFMQAGVVNPSEVARYVLQFGFGIKDPDTFIQPPPPAEGEQPPGQDPAALGPGGPPPEEEMPPEEMPPEGPPEGMPPEGMPPELMAMMAGAGGPPPG